MNNIWKIMFDKMHDDDDISPSKLAMRGLVKTIEWGALVIAIAYAGRHAFNMTYAETTAKIEEKNNNENDENEKDRIGNVNDTSKEYGEIMKLLEQISFEEGTDLSKEIYRLTSVKVGEDPLFQEFNENLQEVETKEELQKLVLTYLREYILRSNDSYSKRCIKFDTIGIFNNHQGIELDEEAREVFITILRSIIYLPIDMTKEEEKEWIQEITRKALATELYEIEEATDSRLSLRLRMSEREIY